MRLPRPMVAKTDYAANAGDGPWSSDAGMPTGIGVTPQNANTVETGVIYQCSITKAADITDGLSNTYLLGEKYINPDNYATGMDNGDDQSAMSAMTSTPAVGPIRATSRPTEASRSLTPASRSKTLPAPSKSTISAAHATAAISSFATARPISSRISSIRKSTAAWAIAKTA